MAPERSFVKNKRASIIVLALVIGYPAIESVGFVGKLAFVNGRNTKREEEDISAGVPNVIS